MRIQRFSVQKFYRLVSQGQPLVVAKLDHLRSKRAMQQPKVEFSLGPQYFKRPSPGGNDTKATTVGSTQQVVLPRAFTCPNWTMSLKLTKRKRKKIVSPIASLTAFFHLVSRALALSAVAKPVN